MKAVIIAAAAMLSLPSASFGQLPATGMECRGCRKDLFAGQYVYCDGTYAGSTVTHCDWVGGSGAGCTFPAEKSVTLDQCKAKCDADPNCNYYASYSNSICNLFMMNSCELTSWVSSGVVYAKQTSPTALPTPPPSSPPTNPPTPPVHVLVKAKAECRGCRKDLYAGRYVYCNGYYAGSTVTDCAWSGGSGKCSFAPQRNVNKDQCKALCAADPNCHYYAPYYNSICNLFMMTSCETTSWVGDVFSV